MWGVCIPDLVVYFELFGMQMLVAQEIGLFGFTLT